MPEIKKVVMANITNGNSVDTDLPQKQDLQDSHLEIMGFFLVLLQAILQ